MKNITKVLLLAAGLLIYSSISAAQDVVDPSTLNNKIMAGYQGWFAASGDGSGYGWIHWSRGTRPDANNITIDMWPDMREYDADELFETDFIYSDFTNAGLYSAYTRKTVERHVKWMKDYGIDGVFVQRFLGSTAKRTDLRDTVLQNVRNGAEKYGRVFANMYDLSGGSTETMVEWIKDDWMHLVDDIKILESPSYLHHNGRPVLSIWGFGLSGRPGTPAEADALIQWLTTDAPEKYRVTLKAGVDDKWQTHSAEWQDIYEKFDIISPWSVGRYGDIEGANNFREDKIEPDLLRTQDNNIDYMPVVFPGFSWYNLKYGASPLNQRPRNGGKFLWHQFYNAVDAGCNMVYVAMYDEVDEGTAIFKLAENDSQTPTTGAFVTLDYDGYKLPSDWYLRLTGEASKMLRNEISLNQNIPIVAYPNNAEFISQELPTIMDPDSTETISLTFKNTGVTSWSKLAAYKLLFKIDSSLSPWGLKQLDFEEGESIGSGESKTFTFDIVAPVLEGVYSFQWSLLQEENGWIDMPSKTRLINVTENPTFLDDCDAMFEWNSTGSLALNDSEKKQGTACIEFNGSGIHSSEFEKDFPIPYNSGLTEYDATLQFWYFVSDASLAESGISVILGSDGSVGDNVFTWTEGDLQTGWNLISLSLSEAITSGSPDLNAINWFRIAGEKTGEITTRLDEIQLFDKNSSTTKYNLIVNQGKGAGEYVEDALVKITANEVPSGNEFAGWKANAGNPLFEDDKALLTRIRMPNTDVELTAEYKMFGEYLDDCDDISDWNSSGSLSLNTTDNQEGSACIEFSGDQTDEFKKAFEVSHNSGVEVENGRLEFWYYVSNASLLGSNNQLELGSAGRNDQEEYNWNLSGLNDGWNFISVKFSDASISGSAPDLSAINWFRLYNFKSGDIISRIDAIEIVDPDAGVKYPLTIINGSGDGSYYKGAEIRIVSDPAEPGYQFNLWQAESGNPLIEDVNASNTTLIMGEEAAIVKATFGERYYELTVINGTGDGSYLIGTDVNIQANPAEEGFLFNRWLIEYGDPIIEDEEAISTLLTMGGADSTVIKASYAEIKYPLTVRSGSGSGYYSPATSVDIVAYPAPEGFVFDQWVLETGSAAIEDLLAPTTTLITGQDSSALAATYKLETAIDYSESPVKGLKIYPNPTSDKFSIRIALKNEGDLSISLLDLSGRVIRNNQKEIHLQAEDNIITYPVSGIAKGSYFMKLNVEGTVITRLVIIQ